MIWRYVLYACVCVYICISKLLSSFSYFYYFGQFSHLFYSSCVFHKSFFFASCNGTINGFIIFLKLICSFLEFFLWRWYFFKFIWLVHNFHLLCICILKFTVSLFSTFINIFMESSPPPLPLVVILSRCAGGFCVDWQRRDQLAVWSVIS